jgi:hypothetical protein
VSRSSYDHKTGTFSAAESVHPNHFIVFEGLHPFVFQRMRDVFDIKVFMATDEGLRRSWKLKRDTTERGHTPEKVQAELERRMPDSERFVQPQAEFADWIVEYVSKESEGREPILTVRHRISSAVVEIEKLVEELVQRKPTVSCAWAMEPSLKRQVLEVSGSLPASEVQAIALRLYPELLDWLPSKPRWRADLQGVNQLVFVSVLHGLQHV